MSKEGYGGSSSSTATPSSALSPRSEARAAVFAAETAATRRLEGTEQTSNTSVEVHRLWEALQEVRRRTQHVQTKTRAAIDSCRAWQHKIESLAAAQRRRELEVAAILQDLDSAERHAMEVLHGRQPPWPAQAADTSLPSPSQIGSAYAVGIPNGSHSLKLADKAPARSLNAGFHVTSSSASSSNYPFVATESRVTPELQMLQEEVRLKAIAIDRLKLKRQELEAPTAQRSSVSRIYSSQP